MGYPHKTVISAGVVTAAMSAGLTLYAFYTKVDFTFCGAFLFAMLLAYVASGLLYFFYNPE